MWCLDMYFVELQDDIMQSPVIRVYISVEQSLFLNYLSDKLLLFPLHIAFQEHFWKPSKPYIDTLPKPANQRNLLKLNTNMQIVIPTNSLINNVHKTRESLVYVLLNWLDDSYIQYQIDFKNKLINNF